MRVSGKTPLNSIEEDPLQLRRDRPNAPAADLAIIDLQHWRYVRGGPGHEDLVRQVELAAVDATLTVSSPSSRAASSITVARVMPTRMLSELGGV